MRRRSFPEQIDNDYDSSFAPIFIHPLNTMRRRLIWLGILATAFITFTAIELIVLDSFTDAHSEILTRTVIIALSSLPLAALIAKCVSTARLRFLPTTVEILSKRYKSPRR